MHLERRPDLLSEIVLDNRWAPNKSLSAKSFRASPDSLKRLLSPVANKFPPPSTNRFTLATWPALATAIRWVGAAYLGYLGVKLLSAWAKAGQQPDGAASTRAGGELGLGSLVAIGAANNLLNPKALLFFALFLPQFTTPGLGNQPLQLATLGLLLSAIAFAFNLLMSFAFASLRSLRIDSPRLQRHGNGVVGALFVLLASRLALGKTA